MKKFIAIICAVLAASMLSVPTLALDEQTTEPAYSIVVSGKTLELDDLPLAPYREGETVMVPLRMIGEALGYIVDWDAESGAITIDDDYIQKATLFDGTSAVVFERRLKIIDMSREIENSVKTVVHDGYTYVPFEFFREFFNDAEIEGSVITIAPSMCQLDGIEPDEHTDGDSGTGSQRSLYSHGLDVISLMCEIAGSDDYLSFYTDSDELGAIVRDIRAGDHTSPKAVYAVSVDADSLSTLALMAGIDLGGASDELRAYISQRVVGSIATQLNAMGGASSIAAASICTAGKTFVSEDIEGSVIYLYTYENAVPVAVTFTVGEDHTVSANGVFVVYDGFKCGSVDEIKASFGYMDVEVTEVTAE